jgi:hypothetical protein
MGAARYSQVDPRLAKNGSLMDNCQRYMTLGFSVLPRGRSTPPCYAVTNFGAWLKGTLS